MAVPKPYSAQKSGPAGNRPLVRKTRSTPCRVGFLERIEVEAHVAKLPRGLNLGRYSECGTKLIMPPLCTDASRAVGVGSAEANKSPSARLSAVVLIVFALAILREWHMRHAGLGRRVRLSRRCSLQGITGHRSIKQWLKLNSKPWNDIERGLLLVYYNKTTEISGPNAIVSHIITEARLGLPAARSARCSNTSIVGPIGAIPDITGNNTVRLHLDIWWECCTMLNCILNPAVIAAPVEDLKGREGSGGSPGRGKGEYYWLWGI
ncbi:hypothetical protein V8E53_009085 [Lactarius tabidus]